MSDSVDAQGASHGLELDEYFTLSAITAHDEANRDSDDNGDNGNDNRDNQKSIHAHIVPHS